MLINIMRDVVFKTTLMKQIITNYFTHGFQTLQFCPNFFKCRTKIQLDTKNIFIVLLKELEFDLYDYEHKRMLCDTSETDRDFSFSELAPKRLFDSKDTIINIADEVLDDVNFKPSQNTFGTPVVLRRGDFNSRYFII